MTIANLVVSDGTVHVLVPDLWESHSWTRPLHYLTSINGEASAPEKSHRYLHHALISGFEVKSALRRTSLRASSPEALSFDDFSSILRAIYAALEGETRLFAGIVTKGVVGWKDGAWLVENQPRCLLAPGSTFQPSLTQRLIQGQAWALGEGVFALFGIDWSWLDASENKEVAYAEALVSCGRAGHSLVLEGQHRGLQARMTPAIHESTGSEILSLPDSRDVLYAIRLARPKEEPR